MGLHVTNDRLEVSREIAGRLERFTVVMPSHSQYLM